MLEPRQTFRGIQYLSVFVHERVSGKKKYQERMVKLRCPCGNPMKMSLSKWNNNPPECCGKCAIKRNRSSLWVRREW